MNPEWDKTKSVQCALDREKLHKIYTAICGDEETNVIGLSQRVPSLEKRVDGIETKIVIASTAGMSIWKACGIVGGWILAIFVIAEAVVALASYLSGKHS